MALAVGDVVELVRPDDAVGVGLLQLLGHGFRHAHVIAGILIGQGRDLAQFRAGKAQHVLLLLALRLRNDDERLVAARIADEGEADTRVARGTFDD